jgi:rRNA-processing protein EBP2
LPEQDDSEEEEEQEWEDDDSEGEDGEGLLDVEAEESDGDEDDQSEHEAPSTAALLNESDTDSESEVDMEEKIERKPKSILKKTENRRKQRLAEANENDDEAEEESDIALSDLEDLPEEEREDLFVKTKLSINNQPALLAAVKRISIQKDSSTSFVTHQTVVSSEPTEPKIEDISDDLQRELQLYSQSLEAAKKARALLKAEGLPFSRPKDYFAEMVKDDGHMQKVKAKLIEEATAKKASAEARKLRDLKKFGKQVQVAKLQERHKEKRETLEKIKALKKSTFDANWHIPQTDARIA